MRYKHVDDAESKKKMEIQACAHTVSDLLQDIGLGALNRAEGGQSGNMSKFNR